MLVLSLKFIGFCLLKYVVFVVEACCCFCCSGVLFSFMKYVVLLLKVVGVMLKKYVVFVVDVLFCCKMLRFVVEGCGCVVEVCQLCW